MAQNDPFSWAKEYYAQSGQRAAQEQDDAQRSLLSVFQAEAQRQLPYNNLPVSLAEEGVKFGHEMELANTRGQYLLESRRGSRSGSGRFLEPGKLGKMIVDTANTMGEDPAAALATAQVESSFDPNAHNASGAAGVFQFMPGTWDQFGGGGDPYDPVSNVTAGIRLQQSNNASLANYGIDTKANPEYIYLAHQQGIGGAAALIRAAQRGDQRPAGHIISGKNIAGNRGNPNAPASVVIEQLTHKWKQAYIAQKARLAKSTPFDTLVAAIGQQNADPNDVAANTQQQQDDTYNSGGQY